MKVAIIGSREGFTEKFVHDKLWVLLANLLTSDTIITGGARGVDSYAESFAKKFGCNLEIIEPIDFINKTNYLFRNVEIITKADAVIAFWDGKSKGTEFVINYASHRAKDLKVVRLNAVDEK